MSKQAYLSQNGQSGFTIIEMVVVLVLVGILGSVIVSRFVSPSSFNEVAARDTMITTIRSAQQMALGREDVSISIVSVGDQWRISANENGTQVNVGSFPSRSIILTTGSTAASADSCATGFEDALENDFEISFDGRGNVVSLTNNAVTEAVENGIRICVNEKPDFSLCVSPAGYAHAGTCDA